MAHLLLIRTTAGRSQLFAGRKPRGKILPFSPPLSLLSLGAILENNHHQIHVLDVAFEKDPLGDVQQRLPSLDAVVVYVAPGCEVASQFLVEFIKRLRPDLPVVLDGAYCTSHAGETLQHIPADISLNGEGELIIEKILQTLEDRGNLSDIPGVYFRKDNVILAGRPAEAVKDLDSLPFPARHFTEQYEYGWFNGIHLSHAKFTSIVTSRGCPRHCRFCASGFLNGGYRQRSVKNVFEEFRTLAGTYGSVLIDDENFFADRTRAVKILEGLITSGLDLELFIGGARVDTVDQDLYTLMKRAGVRFISFGIESGTQDILDYYQKKITLDQICDAVHLADEAGMISCGNFIFGAPVESHEQMEETMHLAMSMPLDLAIFRPLTYQRGSPLWHEAVDAGRFGDDLTYCFADTKRTGGVFSEKELTRYCHWAFLRYYLRPQYAFKELTRCARRRDFTVVKSLLSVI